MVLRNTAMTTAKHLSTAGLTLSQKARRVRGVSTMECVILLGVLSAIVIGGLYVFGDHSEQMFSRVTDQLSETPAAERRISEEAGGAHRLGEKTVNFEYAFYVVLAILVVGTSGVSFVAIRKKLKSTPKPTQLPDSPQPQSHCVFEKRQKIRRLIESDHVVFNGDLLVRHVMTTKPLVLARNESVTQGLTRMQQAGAEYALICGKSGNLEGIASKHFLDKTKATTVSKAMLTKPLTVAPTAQLTATVTQMLIEGVSCVVVMEDGQPVGTLTAMDVQLALQAVIHILVQQRTGSGDASASAQQHGGEEVCASTTT